MSENLRRYTQSLYAFDSVVNRAPADAWAQPSPCDEWDAAGVVAHVVGVSSMVTAAAGGEAPEATGDPVADWRAARAAVLAALDQQGALQQLAQTPFGEMPLDAFIGILFLDATIHSWDLATALGIDPGMDSELAETGLGALSALGDGVRAPGLFEAAVEAPADADPATRLAALAGRTV